MKSAAVSRGGVEVPSISVEEDLGPAKRISLVSAKTAQIKT